MRNGARYCARIEHMFQRNITKAIAPPRYQRKQWRRLTRYHAHACGTDSLSAVHVQIARYVNAPNSRYYLPPKPFATNTYASRRYLWRRERDSPQCALSLWENALLHRAVLRRSVAVARHGVDALSVIRLELHYGLCSTAAILQRDSDYDPTPGNVGGASHYSYASRQRPLCRRWLTGAIASAVPNPYRAAGDHRFRMQQSIRGRPCRQVQ